MRLRSTRLTAIASAAKRIFSAFSPASLFAAGEQGAWYDPSDFNRYMEPLGPELVTNGDFSGGTAGWTLAAGGTATVSGGVVTLTNVTSRAGISQFSTTVVGRSYRVIVSGVNLGNSPANSARVTLGASQFALAAGTTSLLYVASGTSTEVVLWQNATTEGLNFSVDNISVRELTAIDTATLFQDSAGTTPVTAVEQPVGLMLDKSKGLVLGPELVTNGDFSNGTNEWSSSSIYTSTATVVDGVLRVSNTQSYGLQKQAIACVVGKSYVVSGDARRVSVATAQIAISPNSTGASAVSNSITTSSTFVRLRCQFVATASIMYICLGGSAGNTIGDHEYDNISVRELPGNHAFQSTAASRPVLSARVNLLTNTETLATQTVTTAATTQRLRFEGTGSVTLSGTATGTYSAGSHTFTTTDGSLTITVSGSVTKADLRVANDGVGLPAYQRVNTSTDYDTAGFPLYLKFDGVDDGMQTNSINFTSTDKVTVWAGVRKLSDTAVGFVAELSANYNNNNGTFFLTCSDSTTVYRVASRGNTSSSTNQQAILSAFAAPDTAVITGVANIAGDLSRIRRNGAVGTDATGDQGTGNYGNYPLYIGRRGGSTLPFNGRLHSLIVRGAQSTTQQIEQTEAYVNARTKAF